MLEYIKREELLEKAKKLASGSFSTPLIISAIEYAPAVDVVEVVRCKDCQYGRGNADGINLKVPFMYFCTYDDFSYNGEDHFCSYGVKKEGAEKCV